MNSDARRSHGAGRPGRSDPARPVKSLGVGQQQLVEIAAGLSRRCEVLILDEPTAALTDPEIELLFTQIPRLKAAAWESSISPIGWRKSSASPTASPCCATAKWWPRAATRISVLTKSSGSWWAGNWARPLRAEALRPARCALRVAGLTLAAAVQDVSFEVRNGAKFWALPA